MKHLVVFLLIAGVGLAQEGSDRVVVPFSDPAKPRALRVKLMNGGVTIHGYEGKDAIIEAKMDPGKGKAPRQRPDGLRRLDIVTSGLFVEEQDSVVTVGAKPNSDTKLAIQVPVATSVMVRMTNGDDVVIDNISGEIDVQCNNGGIKMSNVSGAVIAHALNDNVVVKFDKVMPGKTMSFSSLNGDIDVTFPADMKARLKLKSNQGEIYSDFDINMEPSSRQPTVEDNRTKGGKYRVYFDKGLYGNINGGGPEVQMTTFNGKILIRKAK